MPFIEPAPGVEHDFWIEIYNYSAMLWLLAVTVLGLAFLAKLRLWVIKWIEQT